MIERKWADRLIVRGFFTKYDNDLQNNLRMALSYGEATYGGLVGGSSVRYLKQLTENLQLDLTGLYSRRVVDFSDKSRWVYNWRGERIKERGDDGENGARSDRTTWQDNGYARAVLTWRFSEAHELRLASTVQFFTRTGEERIRSNPAARDPQSAERKLLTAVSGVEYQLNAIPIANAGKGGDKDFDVGLRDSTLQMAIPSPATVSENIAFARPHNYRVKAEDPLTGGCSGARTINGWRRRRAQRVRYTFRVISTCKASYEYAISPASSRRVFGATSRSIRTSARAGAQPQHQRRPPLDLIATKTRSLLVDLTGSTATPTSRSSCRQR